MYAHCRIANGFLIPVSVAFEWTSGFDADVICLFLGERCELSAQSRKVQARNFFVELFGEEVHVVFVSLLFGFQKVELREYLIRERARHDERGVSSCASEVEQS